MPRPFSPFLCLKQNDHSPDCMRASLATAKTDLKPIPFSPMWSSEAHVFFELLLVVQIASIFFLLNPSSFVSMIRVFEVTSNFKYGGEELIS